MLQKSTPRDFLVNVSHSEIKRISLIKERGPLWWLLAMEEFSLESLLSQIHFQYFVFYGEIDFFLKNFKTPPDSIVILVSIQYEDNPKPKERSKRIQKNSRFLDMPPHQKEHLKKICMHACMPISA